MADLSVRGLGDDVRERLRVRAARNRRSMEAEARQILTDAVESDRPGGGLVGAIRREFSDVGGVDIDVPPRRTGPRAADLME